MYYERDVFNHNEAVCDRHASEDHVDGVPHVLVGEHQDVGNVEQGAQHAHQHGQPAVDWRINFLKKFYCPECDDFYVIITLIREKSHIVMSGVAVLGGALQKK